MGCSGRFWAVKTCRDDRMHVALTRLRPRTASFPRLATSTKQHSAARRGLAWPAQQTHPPARHSPAPYGIMRSQELGWVRVRGWGFVQGEKAEDWWARTRSVSPVIHAACGELRNSTALAMSSASPQRPSGTAPRIRSTWQAGQDRTVECGIAQGVGSGFGTAGAATQGRDGGGEGRPYHLVLFDAEALAPLRHDRAIEIRVYRPGAHLLNHHIRDDICFRND